MPEEERSVAQADDFDPSLSARTARQKWLSLIIAAFWAAFMVLNGLRGRRITTMVDGVACITTLVLWGWTWRAPQRRLATCGQLTLLLCAVTLSSLASVSGMSRSVALWFITATPLVASYVLGARAAIGWAVAAIGFIAAVFFVELTGGPPQEFVPEAGELMMGRAMLVAMLAAFGVAARRATDLHVAALRDQERITHAHAQAVQRQAEELAHARDDALAAARAKSAFLAAISHEIRTPLNAIVGMAELLTRGVGEEHRRMADTIHNAGKSLVRIVSNVLQFSTLEAGGGSVDHSPFDLTTCVQEVISLLDSQARERGLSLTLDVDERASRFIVGDEQLLRQVLVNLIANAVKFTERGGVVVSVRGAPPTMTFEVRDSGPGIDPARHHELFQPFKQLEESGAARRGGSGLGLAISRRLVHLMGGDIEVESTPGQGSVFRFSIEAGVAPQVPASRAAEKLDDSPSRRVLLVEDNDDNQLVLVRMLEVLGHQVDVAGSGRAALEALALGSYDVVLMDMHMPEMDGLQATRRIHETVARESVPWIIALTADVLDAQRAECAAAGMHDFLAKPVDLRTLGDAIGRAPPSRRRAPETQR